MAIRFNHSSAVIAASHSVKCINNADVSFKSNQTLKIPFSQRRPFSSSNLLFASSVGSSPSHILPRNDRHLLFLNSAACIAAISASWLFISAIPTLLAFKTVAQSLEKLLDVTREELPDTMAAVRLSGMEISDLTMELGDLGHGITEGVRSTTHAVCLAEDRLRRLTMSQPGANNSDKQSRDAGIGKKS
ncbi:hypothetical protein ZOSMA_167G00040 [Zostera marina]|uniref:Transmembrane protein n=1 Tax=Zostera marina TaxID=29655 RepID=A0A0K9PTK7_ZOSMR|nr:hypothetical protein ZOSMA_167G00040 [Zostera marina]